jgi:hypothetical protein
MGRHARALFARVTRKLVVLSHHQAAPNVMPLVRQYYDGPVEIGEDSMVTTIGDTISVRRPPAP